MTSKLIPVLQQEISKALKYQKTLQHSLNKCLAITMQPYDSYTIDELDALEVLTSRFARASDIIIKKLFRVIESIDLEEKGSIRDLINQAEKKQLIDSADTFIKIRELRNLIAHEYQESDLNFIFEQTILLTPTILNAINNINQYAKKYST